MFEMVIQYYFYLKQQQNPQFEEVADVEDLIIEFIIQLKKYKSKEKRNSYLEDNFLNGLINVIYAILFYNPEFIEQAAIEHGLINEVFNNCLFQQPQNAPDHDIGASFDPNLADIHQNKCKLKST